MIEIKRNLIGREAFSICGDTVLYVIKYKDGESRFLRYHLIDGGKYVVCTADQNLILWYSTNKIDISGTKIQFAYLLFDELIQQFATKDNSNMRFYTGMSYICSVQNRVEAINMTWEDIEQAKVYYN